MKTRLAVPFAALLAFLVLAAPSSASVSEPRLETCDPTDFPNALVWLKVERTSCATGKETTRQMRAWMRDHLGQGETDDQGWFHHDVNGFSCKARFVGSDEVVERCKKPISNPDGKRLIRALFYID